MHFVLLLLLKGVAVTFITISILALIISYLHGRVPEYLRSYRKYFLIAILICVLLLFIGKAMNREPSLDFFMETSGPGHAPQIPLLNAFQFLRHVDDFRHVDDIGADPAAVPALSESRKITYDILTEEVINEAEPGVFVNSWTFNGQVPGPMLRAKVGDQVTIKITNKETSLHPHNIDLHAVNGPGGGASVTTVNPGETKEFTFKALHPGLYVYHCAAQGLPGVHSAHGQYGLILIEPEEGMPPVDREFYIVQGEIYTTGDIGDKGLRPFSIDRYLSGDPTYVVFNGRVQGLNGKMRANVGDTVRLYVGNGGVNLVSSFHVIGEIFDVVYPEGGWPVQHNIQSTVVPAGGSTMVEFTLDVPGTYLIVDHALARVDKGAWGTLIVEGEWTNEMNEIYSPQPAPAKPDDGMKH